MTKEVATILKNRLAGLPFSDVIAGIVQPVVDEKFTDDTNLRIQKKMPVSYDTNQGKNTFLGSERQLVPDQGRKSFIYFEDFGSVENTKNVRAGDLGYTSSLRLVCWLNKGKLDVDKYAEITAICIGEILKRLITPVAINDKGITRLFCRASRIVQQDAGIFSRYSYDEAELQYLRPPFEYFAIDLQCTYVMRRNYCSS